MICSKCGNDLGIESNSAEKVEYCSFCAKHDFPEGNSIEEVLRWIVQDRGVEVFQNSSVINAILSDLAPKDEKGRIKIRNAMAVGAGEYFHGIVQQGTLNEVSRKQFLSALSSNGFTIEFCNFIFDVFAYSINQSVAVREEETTKTQLYQTIAGTINQSVAVQEEETSKTSANDSYENIAANTIQNSKKISPNIKTDTKRDKEETVKGKLTFPSGVVYEGELIHKYPNGKGKMIWPDGSTFEGQFLNGCRVNGQFHYPNGVIYEGDFQKNMRQGTAKEVYPNGDMFEGEFLNDKRKKGIYTFADGRVFEGEYENGCSEGRGKQTWPDGTTYKGDWHKDMRHGKGEMFWPSGIVYEGDFLSNKRHGKGTMTWPDGTIYDGDWKNDKRDGTGITTLPNKQQYLQTYSQGNLINERELEITDSKNLKLNALKQCTENRQIVGKDIRIPLPIILKFDNFDGYRLFSISNEHYSYGTRDFTKHKLEGFWKDFKPYGYMRRTTQGETWIEYYDEDGNFVKKFTKNEVPKIFQFTSKIRMNYFNMYDRDIENFSSLVYVEYETKDGNGYRGTTQLFSNKQQGFGVAHYTSGNQFYGKFQEGVPSIGIMLDSDGTIFRGTFKDGLLKGEGMVQWANGDIYEGDFQEGVRTGRGIIKWANGDIYEGDFQEGVRTGRGIIKWANGVIYEGDFLSDQLHGEGTMIWPDGTIYDGDWKDGKREGTGITTLPNKQKYLQTYSQGNLINEREL
jgi:MORN repeat protein